MLPKKFILYLENDYVSTQFIKGNKEFIISPYGC
jgi:hypothetical protein